MSVKTIPNAISPLGPVFRIDAEQWEETLGRLGNKRLGDKTVYYSAPSDPFVKGRRTNMYFHRVDKGVVLVVRLEGVGERQEYQLFLGNDFLKVLSSVCEKED